MSATAELDWPRVLRLARFHRVQGLVWRALARSRIAVSEEVRDALSAEAVAITAANLRSAAECERIAAAFADADIDLLFVKGLTLGALAYGNPMIKAAVDVDLLVHGEQLRKSAELLAALGYRLEIPSGPPERLTSWHERHKESVWRHAHGKLQIDLHTRLADNPQLIASIDMRSPRQMVRVAKGTDLPTLADDFLFSYVAVHGASSAWFRLKWISDFAGLIAALSPAEIERRYQASQVLGAGRSAGQALLLADYLFGSLAEAPMLRAELRRDSGHGRLYRAALRQLAGRAEPAEPTEKLLGTARIHATQLLLLPGLRFKISEAWRQLKTALA